MITIFEAMCLLSSRKQDPSVWEGPSWVDETQDAAQAKEKALEVIQAALRELQAGQWPGPETAEAAERIQWALRNAESARRRQYGPGFHRPGWVNENLGSGATEAALAASRADVLQDIIYLSSEGGRKIIAKSLENVHTERWRLWRNAKDANQARWGHL